LYDRLQYLSRWNQVKFRKNQPFLRKEYALDRGRHIRVIHARKDQPAGGRRDAQAQAVAGLKGEGNVAYTRALQAYFDQCAGSI
jgi:hypothetical protein